MDAICDAFDSTGTVEALTRWNTEPKCSMKVSTEEVWKALADLGIPFERSGLEEAAFRGANCIDFLGKVFERGSFGGMYRKYAELLGEQPFLRVCRTDPAAVMPSKTRASDVGYDLTVVREHSRPREGVVLYDTGLKIRIQHGYYAEIVPRSSLSKSGYILANGVGIVDPAYDGTLLVALARLDPKAAPVQLPFRCCQIVIRRQYHAEVEEVSAGSSSAAEWTATGRGTGGFGSTGGGA